MKRDGRAPCGVEKKLSMTVLIAAQATGPPPEIPDRRRPSVIVFQLQSGTRIYFALPPEGATKGEQP